MPTASKQLCTDSLKLRQPCWRRCTVQRAGSWPTPASRLTTAMTADAGMNHQPTETLSMASPLGTKQHSELSRPLGVTRGWAGDFRLRHGKLQ